MPRAIWLLHQILPNLLPLTVVTFNIEGVAEKNTTAVTNLVEAITTIVAIHLTAKVTLVTLIIIILLVLDLLSFVRFAARWVILPLPSSSIHGQLCSVSDSYWLLRAVAG